MALNQVAMAASLMSASISIPACTGAARPVEQTPDASESAALARPSLTPATPRRFALSRGQTHLTIADEPGVLLDENAPPPVPGSPMPSHPFLSGACGGGDPLGCSEARTLLEQSATTDEFVEKLVAAGFALSGAP